MLTTVVFGPHADLWGHAFPEALVADALRQDGQRIVHVGCGRVLDAYCVCMTARGLVESSPASGKAEVCRTCQRNDALLRDEFGFEGYRLSDVLTPEDLARASARVAEARPEEVLQLREHGIPIGRHALYEFILDRKKSAPEVSREEWTDFLPHLRNAWLALYAGQRILERERPDRVVVYNSLYAVHRIFCALAEGAGALPYFLHAGLNLAHRLQTLALGRDHGLRYMDELAARWPEWESRCVDAASMRRITDHFTVLFRGASAFGYSSGARGASAGVRERLGVPAGKRIVVAALSSPDEWLAAEVNGARPAGAPLLFRDQVEWIRALQPFFAARPELFLVVRPHPREFPNRREGVKSEHAARLEAELAALPANASVNWPGDGISAYDLAGEASLVLNAWSSLGKEMTLLGLPVLTYCPRHLLYPASLHESATTHAGYAAAIEGTLAAGPSLERSRRAYRWYALEHWHGMFDIADGFSRREEAPTFAGKVERRLRRALASDWEERRDCARRPRQLREAQAMARLVREGGRTRLDVPRALPPAPTLEEETRSLHAELARLRRHAPAGLVPA